MRIVGFSVCFRPFGGFQTKKRPEGPLAFRQLCALYRLLCLKARRGSLPFAPSFLRSKTAFRERSGIASFGGYAGKSFQRIILRPASGSKAAPEGAKAALWLSALWLSALWAYIVQPPPGRRGAVEGGSKGALASQSVAPKGPEGGTIPFRQRSLKGPSGARRVTDCAISYPSVSALRRCPIYYPGGAQRGTATRCRLALSSPKGNHFVFFPSPKGTDQSRRRERRGKSYICPKGLRPTLFSFRPLWGRTKADEEKGIYSIAVPLRFLSVPKGDGPKPTKRRDSYVRCVPFLVTLRAWRGLLCRASSPKGLSEKEV